MAEYERALIGERAAPAREVAAVRWKTIGRAPALADDQAQTARTMYGVSTTTIATTLNVVSRCAAHLACGLIEGRCVPA